MNDNSHDDLAEMIKNSRGIEPLPSWEEMLQAMEALYSSNDEAESTDLWLERYHTLPAYILDVTRDGSEGYFRALTEAILAITRGDHGSIEYKGYRIYYLDTPHVHSVSVADGHKEYSYELSFRCDALMSVYLEKYHSEEERLAYLDPENDLFGKTLALLDRVLETLDEGKWLRSRKKLRIRDFRGRSSERPKFPEIEWEERYNAAADTLTFLMDDAIARAKGLPYTEDDFCMFADVIRRMVFFADLGKRAGLVMLEGFVRFDWKPSSGKDRYIWRCMHEFGQGDLPDRLLENCAIYYFLDNPQGWEAVADLFPILALGEMCQEYEPDDVKNGMLKAFDLVPDAGYRERVEKLIEEDRAMAQKGEDEDDRKDI